MRCSPALGGLICSSALLLPYTVAADSQLRSGTRGPSSVSAHVRFRVIIPTMLSLEMVDSPRATGTQTVSIVSNSRNVALGATVGTSALSMGHVILSAAARRTIAQDAPCVAQRAPGAAGSEAAHVNSAPVERVICTVSMP
jgi:hypothetical protein